MLGQVPLISIRRAKLDNKEIKEEKRVTHGENQDQENGGQQVQNGRMTDYIITSDEVVEIYTNRGDTTKFGVGYIRGVSEDSILIESITPHGFYDGYTVILIDDIYRISVNTLYVHKIKKLWEQNGLPHKAVPQTNSNQFANLIDFAYSNNRFISIELYNSNQYDLAGVIKSISNNTIELCLVNDYGMPDGNSVVKMEDISLLVCDSQDELALEILYSSYQNE